MLYTDKLKLTVLNLPYERSEVAFDELKTLLKKRPANMIYVEIKERLYGIVSTGDIYRAREKEKKFVEINTNFTVICSNDYMKARRIFLDKKTINALPLVDETGKLLGAYTRWDDRNYMEWILKQEHMISFSKLAQSYALVKPCSIFKNKKTILLKMREVLKTQGVSVKIIERDQIVTMCHTVDKILFVDEDEMRGTKALYAGESGEQFGVNKYTTYSRFFHMDSTQEMDMIEASMKRLREKGVHILLLYFGENENGFYDKFQKEAKEKFEKLDGDKIKKDFFGEIYNEIYEQQQFSYPYSIDMKDIVPVLKDTNEPLFHAYQDERLTVGQPDTNERCLYMYGPCIILGSYVEDKHTIASWLQNKINQAGIKCKVVNKGIHCSSVIEWEKVLTAPLKKGDIVVLYLDNYLFRDIPNINLINSLEKNEVSASYIMTTPCHCNYKVNQIYADDIYEELLPILLQPEEDRREIEKETSFADMIYINKYFSDFDASAYDVIGSIVMNCNPFTQGHRYLIEEALKQVDFLIIFVVEEDRSVFSFDERYVMVCEGVADLKNIKVVPSGEYILSQATFPEYFIKRADGDIVKNTENDVMIFAKHIASRLNITYRFVGEELEDIVTNEYNCAMKRILPNYGIKVIEIPRKKNGQKRISATAVRQCLEDDDRKMLKELVPESTIRILYSRND